MNYRAGSELNQWLWLLIRTKGVRKLKCDSAVNTSSTTVHNLSLRTNVGEKCQLPGKTVLTQSPSSTKTGDGVSSWAASRTGCCCEQYRVSGPHLHGHVCISVCMMLLVISVLCGHLNRRICWRGSTWQQLTSNVSSWVPESHDQFLHATLKSNICRHTVFNCC